MNSSSGRPPSGQPPGSKAQSSPAEGWSTGGLGYLQAKIAPQRVYVVHPFERDAEKAASRSAEARLEEALNLTEAIHVELVGGELVPLRRIRPSSFIGQGKIDELRAMAQEQDIELFVFDCALTPIQQRNLEKALEAKVIDRTALILEIFGDRAHTKEGELQVEYAHLVYQKSRLVRSWTHLERQRGGFGFMGGPGETQIEADRRLIDERLARIRKQLETVKRTRGLHRARRQKAPYPVVALVGYTNAGKSTLFNRLTRAEVKAEDMLFATLDPTLRAVELESGRKVILSDTVGFISELPTTLVAAFRATLEEVLEADMIVHVRDCSHADSEAQKTDVEAVLGELGVDLSPDPEGQLENATPVMEVYNKADLLSEEERAVISEKSLRMPQSFMLSAITGEGCDNFLRAIDASLGKADKMVRIVLPYREGAAIAWLKANAKVLSEDAADAIQLEIRIDPLHLDRFKARFKADAISITEL